MASFQASGTDPDMIDLLIMLVRGFARPFANRTQIYHLNTILVWYLDVYCTQQLCDPKKQENIILCFTWLGG